MKGKAMIKQGAPLSTRRLFSGEGWKPVDFAGVRQLCEGVKQVRHWDRFDVPANCFYSSSPIPVQTGRRATDFTGTCRGTVAVVGYYGQISSRQYWVTVCKCGTFELINEKTLRTKPVSPQHCCALCRLAESKRYHQECCDLAEAHGLDYEALRAEYRRGREAASKRNTFGLIHFIRKAISDRTHKP